MLGQITISKEKFADLKMNSGETDENMKISDSRFCVRALRQMFLCVQEKEKHPFPYCLPYVF